MTLKLTGAIVAALVAGSAVLAQDAPFGMEIKARQGLMNYMALNIGVLAGMAKGEAEYNAEAAKQAADAIASVATIDMSKIWPKGSDKGANPATNALPAIWDEGSAIGDKLQALRDGAAAMQAAAGTDVDSLKAAMGGLGGACAGCHKAFRAAM